MLAVERGASLVSRLQSAESLQGSACQGIVLITGQTLSSSTVLDGVGPNIHDLAAYERLDPFSSIWARSRSRSMLFGPSSMLNFVRSPPVVGACSVSAVPRKRRVPGIKTASQWNGPQGHGFTQHLKEHVPLPHRICKGRVRRTMISGSIPNS
jgi:hypothetical protein